MIKQIILLDFRGHTRTLDFEGGLNRLRGPNEIGKSTVKEAIAFAWLGTDSSGTKNPDHLISEGKDLSQVALVTEHVTVLRQKRRGSTSTIKLTRHGFPPVTMTQSELSALLKLSLDSFMSCWHAGYFMSLTSNARLAVLAELAKVDRRALLQSMLPEGTLIPAKVKLINPKIDADAVATERRQLQNVKASDEGGLSQVKAQLTQLSGDSDVDIESYAQALNTLNSQIESHDFYKRASSKYREEKIKWGESINRKGSLTAEKLALRIPLKAEFDGLESACASIEQKLQAVQHGMGVLKNKFKPMPAAPKKPEAPKAGSTCGTCGQVVAETHVNHIMGSYEKLLLEHNKEAREVATFNDKVTEAMNKGQEAERGLLADSIHAKGASLTLNKLFLDNKKRLTEIEKELLALSKLTDPSAPVKPEGDEEALRKEQLEVSTALNVARRQVTQLEQLRKQEAMLIDAVKVKERQIRDLSALEHSLKNLPILEARQLLETLHVSGVTVELLEGELVVKGGNIPYPSLSSGRKMKVDLAFCMSLRKAGGPRAPSWVFVDNSDLMDSFQQLLPPGVQVFSAEVDDDLEELQVISTL
jgi:hypothetical protein